MAIRAPDGANNGFDYHLTSVRGLWESLIYRLEAIGFGTGVVARERECI